MSVSRLSIVVAAVGSSAKAILTDRGLVDSPSLPLGLVDVNPSTDAIAAAAEIGDSVGIQAYLNSLTTNPVRYSITAQSHTGYLAVDSVTGSLTKAGVTGPAIGQTGTVTVRSVDQVTGAQVSETYSYTVTA